MSNQENNRRPTEGTPEHFPRLLEDLEVGILVVGPKTEALHFNDAAMHLLGLTRDQLTGHPVFAPSWNIISEDGTPFSAEEHPATRAIATKLPVRGVVAGVLRPLQADRKWILCNAMPHLAADGTVSEVICSFIDITTQKHSEESGRAAHDVMKKQPAVPEEGDGGQPQRILEISRDTTVRQEAELMSLEREKLLHRLADRLVESQDEERRRIARDLHDNASQILTAILSRLHLV